MYDRPYLGFRSNLDLFPETIVPPFRRWRARWRSGQPLFPLSGAAAPARDSLPVKSLPEKPQPKLAPEGELEIAKKSLIGQKLVGTVLEARYKHDAAECELGPTNRKIHNRLTRDVPFGGVGAVQAEDQKDKEKLPFCTVSGSSSSLAV